MTRLLLLAWGMGLPGAPPAGLPPAPGAPTPAIAAPAPMAFALTRWDITGDPLFDQDPIINSIPDPKARQRLVSSWDPMITIPEWALGYRFDIVLSGATGTPMEEPGAA